MGGLRRLRRVFLNGVVLTTAAAAPSAWAETPAALPAVAPAMAAKRTLQAQAVDALRAAYAELGPGWDAKSVAKKAFETEVLAEPFSFVSDYRTTAEGSEVRVDRDKLKNYLRFAGTLFRAEAPSICAHAHPTPECAPCGALAETLESALAARLEKRGFLVKSGPGVSRESALQGDRAFEDYLARAAEAGCDGALYAETVPDRSAEEDAGSSHMQVRAVAYLSLKDRAGKRLRARGQSVVQVAKDFGEDGDSAPARDAARKLTATLVARQTAELFAQAAGQTAGEVVRAASEERYLRLEGVRSFGAYARFKEAVAAAMPDLRLEERFISPGLVHFALPGNTSIVELGARIKAIDLGEQKIEVVRSDGGELAVVMK